MPQILKLKAKPKQITATTLIIKVKLLKKVFFKVNKSNRK